MKLLKQLALVALVCCGQSVLAMHNEWQMRIKEEVAAMNDEDIVANLQHLHGIILEQDDFDRDFRVYDRNHRFLCFPMAYLTLLRQLLALQSKNDQAFKNLIRFVSNNPNAQIPENLILPVTGLEINFSEVDRLGNVVRHIIENNNLTVTRGLH